jgi:hypothetical protein
VAELAIRVSLNNGDEVLVERVIGVLRRAGFEILGSSTRGVDARAKREVIESFFEVPVRDAVPPQFAGEPRFERLPEGTSYRAYFPRPPQHF